MGSEVRERDLAALHEVVASRRFAPPARTRSEVRRQPLERLRDALPADRVSRDGGGTERVTALDDYRCLRLAATAARSDGFGDRERGLLTLLAPHAVDAWRRAGAVAAAFGDAGPPVPDQRRGAGR